MVALAVLGCGLSGWSQNWNVAVLDQVLAELPPDQAVAQIGDMRVSVPYLKRWRNQLAGLPSNMPRLRAPLPPGPAETSITPSTPR